MRKSHLFGTVFALILFTIISSANAAIIASDDISFAITGQSYVQTLASLFSDGVQALDVPVDSGHTESDEIFDSFINGALPVASHHADSYMDLWVLLMAAVLAVILSEVFHIQRLK